MKTIYQIFSLTLLLALSLNARSFNQQTSINVPFISTVHYPKTVSQPQKLQVFYKGTSYPITTHSTETNKADFELIEAKDSDEFHIIVTESLQLPKNHAITHLFTHSETPYRLFKLSRQTRYEEVAESKLPKISYYWHIEELSHEKASRRLAENSIIFLMDPNLIELESTSWLPDDNFVKLPTIVFNKIKNESEFITLCRKMQLSALDMKFLHTPNVKTSRQVAANCVISLPQSGNKFIAS